MLNMFDDWLKQNNWNIKYNCKKEIALNPAFTNRYQVIDNEYMEFLKKYKAVMSKDDKVWFLCCDVYNDVADLAFKWNEYEILSLEAADDDDEWKSEIEQWWNGKMPIIMSVRDNYSFYAIDLNDKVGSIVRGEEPEFEETELISNSFYEFLEKVVTNQILL